MMGHALWRVGGNKEKDLQDAQAKLDVSVFAESTSFVPASPLKASHQHPVLIVVTSSSMVALPNSSIGERPQSAESVLPRQL